MTSTKQRKITLCIYIVAILAGIIVLLAFYVFQKGPFLYYKFEENISYNDIRFEKLTDDARDSCFYIPVENKNDWIKYIKTPPPEWLTPDRCCVVAVGAPLKSRFDVLCPAPNGKMIEMYYFYTVLGYKDGNIYVYSFKNKNFMWGPW